MAVGKGSILRAAGASAQSKAEGGGTVQFIAAPDAQTEKLIKEKFDKEDKKNIHDEKVNNKENGGSSMSEEKEVKRDGIIAEEAVKAAEEKIIQEPAEGSGREPIPEEKKAAAPKKAVGRPAGRKNTARSAATKAAAPKKTVKPAVKNAPARKPAASKAAEIKQPEPKAEQKPEAKKEAAVNQGRERHPVNKQLPVYLL